MKTLITTLAVLTLSFTTVIAKDGAFTSVIIPDAGDPVQINLTARQWIKITNFTQIPVDDGTATNAAGFAVIKGDAALWVSFATDPRAHAPHEDVFVAGPATIIVSPPDKKTPIRAALQCSSPTSAARIKSARHPGAGAARRGTSQLEFPLPRKASRPLTENHVQQRESD